MLELIEPKLPEAVITQRGWEEEEVEEGSQDKLPAEDRGVQPSTFSGQSSGCQEREDAEPGTEQPRSFPAPEGLRPGEETPQAPAMPLYALLMLF